VAIFGHGETEETGWIRVEKNQETVRVQEKFLTRGLMADTGRDNRFIGWRKKITLNMRKENFTF